MKIAEDHNGDTYRCAYTVAFPGVAYVLDVFQKTSKRGLATPKADKQRALEARARSACSKRVLERYKAAGSGHAAITVERVAAFSSSS